ncbi:hypothetical protein [Corynebacterium casei]|uniref:hypothetical protein n=1 Tax=Corynebacterium casei TaxID=160386 RepID=UPI003FD5C17F
MGTVHHGVCSLAQVLKFAVKPGIGIVEGDLGFDDVIAKRLQLSTANNVIAVL